MSNTTLTPTVSRAATKRPRDTEALQRSQKRTRAVQSRVDGDTGTTGSTAAEHVATLATPNPTPSMQSTPPSHLNSTSTAAIEEIDSSPPSSCEAVPFASLRQGLRSLEPDTNLNDQAVNPLMQRLRSHHLEVVHSPNFEPHLVGKGSPRQGSQHANCGIENKQFMVPLLDRKQHYWTLLHYTADPFSTVNSYDSLSLKRSQEDITNIEGLFRDLIPTLKSKAVRIRDQACAQQRNRNDCGLHMLAIAQNLSQGRENRTVDYNLLRSQYAAELRTSPQSAPTGLCTTPPWPSSRLASYSLSRKASESRAKFARCSHAMNTQQEQHDRHLHLLRTLHARHATCFQSLDRLEPRYKNLDDQAQALLRTLQHDYQDSTAEITHELSTIQSGGSNMQRLESIQSTVLDQAALIAKTRSACGNIKKQKLELFEEVHQQLLLGKSLVVLCRVFASRLSREDERLRRMRSLEEEVAVKMNELMDPAHEGQKRVRRPGGDAEAGAPSALLEKRLQQRLSALTVEEHDVYTFTAKNAEDWAGTPHAESSKNHQQLDQAARLPHTNLTLNPQILKPWHCTGRQVVEKLPAFNPEPAEVRILQNSSGHLTAELQKADQRPLLLIDVSLEGRPDIKAFVKDLQEHSMVKIAVHDPLGGTRPTTVKELDEVMVHRKTTSAPLNFLDIDHRTGFQYTPRSILEASLERQCAIKLQRQDNGKVGEDPVVDSTEFLKEFFICSQAGAISPWHVDAGGWCTWTMVLQGCKWWYFPAGDRNVILKDHESGENLVGDEQIKLKLEPGVILVQFPGQLHSVWTRSDSLMIGGHFYTASTFAASLDTIQKQMEEKLRDNDHMPPRLWLTLATIIQCLDDRTIFPQKHADHALDSLRRLISSPAWEEISQSSCSKEIVRKSPTLQINPQRKRLRKRTKIIKQAVSPDERDHFHAVAVAIIRGEGRYLED